MARLVDDAGSRGLHELELDFSAGGRRLSINRRTAAAISCDPALARAAA